MVRLQRRLRHPQQDLRADLYSPRARARSWARTELRMGRPLVMHAPRWSRPLEFLQSLQPEGEAPFVLTLQPYVDQRGGWMALRTLLDPLFQAAEDRGWMLPMQSPAGLAGLVYLLHSCMKTIQREHPGLLWGVTGLEGVPVELLDAMVLAWRRCREDSEQAPVPLVMMSQVEPAADWFPEARRMMLPDYSLSEVEERLPQSQLILARFTGGIPALVEEISAGDWTKEEDWMEAKTSLGLEMAEAVDAFRSSLDHAGRLERLRLQSLRREEQDDLLLQAGLLRRERRSVALRAPVLGEFLQS